jgi:microcin C transport system substrate-binding protein
VQGMQAWCVNLRRPKFADVRVRRALDLAFDFDWSNANLFYGLYTRSRSYFNNSELEAKGLPSPAELKLLEPLRDKIPPEVFTTEYTSPTNATPQDRRKNLRLAQQLLADAGWTPVKDGNRQILRNAAGENFSFTITLDSPAFERIALPYKEQLTLLGFDVAIQTLDDAQYVRVSGDYDYDMVVSNWGQSLSPGNEQRDFFSSSLADKTKGKNAAGIKDAAIDSLIESLIAAPDRASLIAACKAMDRVLMWNHSVDAIIDALIAAKDRASLIAACHALDRALMWNHYVVPMWFKPEDWIASWTRVAHPEHMPGYSAGYPDIWWFDAAADSKLKKA